MQEQRNNQLPFQGEGRGNVIIDTDRVMDCCRDRDCFENARVYLSPAGQDALSNATNVRIRSVKILWAYVGLDEVPFNRGFYQVTVRYYIDVECEICLGLNRSQITHGLSILEKDVILYGGEGSVQSFSSDPMNDYCNIGNFDTVGSNDPTAVVESAAPIVLGSKVKECGCPTPNNELVEIPDRVKGLMDADPIILTDGVRLYVSFGIFSVIRIQRPAQLVVQAADYSVPEKECVAAQNDDNPCQLFRTMPFPVGEFRATEHGEQNRPIRGGGGCGCGGNRNGN